MTVWGYRRFYALIVKKAKNMPVGKPYIATFADLAWAAKKGRQSKTKNAATAQHFGGWA